MEDDDWRQALRPRSSAQAKVDEMLIPAIAEILDVDEREAVEKIIESPELYSIHQYLVSEKENGEVKDKVRKLERKIESCSCCCRCCGGCC